MSKRFNEIRIGVSLVMSFLIHPRAFAATLPAGLPIEPAMGDAEFNDDKPFSGTHVGRAVDSRIDSDPSSATSSSKKAVYAPDPSEGSAVGAALRLAMVQDGFGAQLRILEYPRPWLALTQTLRYFKNDDEGELYAQRQALLIGVDLHPWRKKFISPFLSSQLGWEQFKREDKATLDSPVIETSAGLELRLGRLASLVGQWTESYYPGLDEAVFLPTGSESKHRGTAEVMFNLKWESGS